MATRDDVKRLIVIKGTVELNVASETTEKGLKWDFPIGCGISMPVDVIRFPFGTDEKRAEVIP
jgi:hypothetical protein